MKNQRPLFIALIVLHCVIGNVFAEEPPVDEAFLTGSVWGQADGGYGYWLEFQPEQTYGIRFAGEGGGQEVRGRYALDGRQVTLTITETVNPEALPEPLRQPTSVWKVAADASNLRFTVKISAGDKYAFWRMESLTREGDVRQAGGQTVIIERHQIRMTNDNARVRKGPGRKFEFSSFSLENADESQQLPYLPKGSTVRVIGRSKGKESIDGVTDYWYYCDTYLGWYSSGPKEGWIFGGLLSEVAPR